MSESEAVKVLTCVGCGLPVVASAAACQSCGVPVSDKAAPYLPRQEARPDIGPMFKWWGIWSLLVWVLAGFDLGTTSSLVLLGISIYYLLKIMRTHFAD